MHKPKRSQRFLMPDAMRRQGRPNKRQRARIAAAALQRERDHRGRKWAVFVKRLIALRERLTIPQMRRIRLVR